MAKAATKLKPVTLTLGDMIDRLDEIREERRPLDAQSKELKGEYDGLKAQIIERLDSDKSLKGSSRRATVSITETTVPVVKDPEALIKYIARTKQYHLLLGQPLSTPSWREAVTLKGCDLPGTETFVKRDLSHTSL